MDSPINEQRVARLVRWCQRVGLDAREIPDRIGALKVTRLDEGHLQVDYLRTRRDKEGRAIHDVEKRELAVTQHRKVVTIKPPGFEQSYELTREWDGSVYLRMH